MTDWLFQSSSKMTIIMLLRTFKFLVCLVYVWIYIHVIQGGGIRNSTEQRVGVLKNARVNEGNI